MNNNSDEIKPKQRDNTKTKKVIWIIVGCFLALVLINMVIKITSQSNSDNTNQTITKSTAENECQNLANLKTQDRNIDVVNAGNYNPQFTESGDKVRLSWNGKDKNSTDMPAFLCELNGTNDNPHIMLLQMGSERLQ